MAEVTWAEGANAARDSAIINRPDWYQVSTPSEPHHFMNGVFRSIIPPDRDPEQVIDQVFDHYRSIGCPFRWTVGPSARPTDLARRLQRRGMTIQFVTAGMVIRTEAPQPAIRPGITVEPVTWDTAADFARAVSGGWGFGNGVEVEPEFVAEIRDQLDRLRAQATLVLARCDGEPAGGGYLQVIRGVGHLKGTAVRPEFRGRGVYQALVAWRLERLRERGVPWAAIQAVLETSAPICRRLGFEEVCRLEIYKSPA